MKCPVCKLENPPNSEKCSCGGYNFKYCRLEESPEGTGVMEPARLMISLGLGFVYPIALIIGAELGGAIGCITVPFLLLAGGQFWISRKGKPGFRSACPGLLATNGVILGWSLFILVVERLSTATGVAILGLLSSFAGTAIASLYARNVRETKDGDR
jgi:hypothetical protein